MAFVPSSSAPFSSLETPAFSHGSDFWALSERLCMYRSWRGFCLMPREWRPPFCSSIWSVRRRNRDWSRVLGGPWLASRVLLSGTLRWPFCVSSAVNRRCIRCSIVEGIRWVPGPCIGLLHVKGPGSWGPPEGGLGASPWNRRRMCWRHARRHPFFMRASLLPCLGSGGPLNARKIIISRGSGRLISTLLVPGPPGDISRPRLKPRPSSPRGVIGGLNIILCAWSAPAGISNEKIKLKGLSFMIYMRSLFPVPYSLRRHRLIGKSIKLKHLPLWWEFTGHREIPLTKASDVELWCFLRFAPE